MDTSTSLISLSESVKALRSFLDEPASRLSYRELAQLLVLEGYDLMNTRLPGFDNTLLKLVATPVDPGFQVGGGKETIPYRMLKLPAGVQNAAVIATTSCGASSLGSRLWHYDVLMLGYWANGEPVWLGASITWEAGTQHVPFELKAFEAIDDMVDFFDQPYGLEHFNVVDVYDTYRSWLESRLEVLRKAETALVTSLTVVGLRRDAARSMLAKARAKEA